MLRRVIRKLMRDEDDAPRAPERPVFPRIGRVRDLLPASKDPPYEPAGGDPHKRIRLLEAKVEYLLDELYRTKSLLRYQLPENERIRELRRYQVDTFDYQWKNLPYHDEFLSNPAWREKAPGDVAARLGVEPEWFEGKKILDAGCGPGRHAWTFGQLGSTVDAFDLSPSALEAARRDCAELEGVSFASHSVLDELPYARDYDLVWSYGVVHHSGDMFGALRNIGKHVRPGGLIYFMVYAEPRRTHVDDFRYYHEIAAIREAIRDLSFEDKARIIEKIEGPSQTNIWFDAISSEVNELFTVPELVSIMKRLGFEDVRRTMPHETMQNIVARKPS